MAAVLVGALLLAERRFSRSQQELFEELFEGQISTLTQARERRSEFFGKKLEEAARDPRFVDEIRKGNAQEARAIVRPEIESLVMEAMQNELKPALAALQKSVSSLAENDKGRPRMPLLGSGERGDLRLFGKTAPAGMSPMIEITDAEGNYLLRQGARPGPAANGDHERARGTKLRGLRGRNLGETVERQEITYFTTEMRDGKAEQVREVFVTPVRDPRSKEFLGTLVAAFPMPSQSEQRLYDQSRRSHLGGIMSGVWVEDHLVSTTVPEAQRGELATLVGRELEKSSKPNREITAVIDGARFHVIYRTLNPGSPFPPAAQVSFYSLAVLDHEIADLRTKIAGFGAAALALALGLILLISRNLSGPIQALAKATTEIERGNFDVRVEARSRDEVGRLADSFNHMAEGLALHEKYRSVLNAVADQTVARELIENSSALGGELREVSVLFCDIRGFTALTEGMPPHDVIALLNEHMTALTSVAYRHGGIVDKFVGDLLMVLFGAPRSAGDDAARAVRCAWEMLATRRSMNAAAALPLDVGIGIATGTVVAGCMGSDQRLSYTVLGERVNLASRLCHVARAGELVIDDATSDRARECITTEAMPPVALKGFTAPVACHRVTAVSEPRATA